jgi:site-specific DNA recombinase
MINQTNLATFGFKKAILYTRVSSEEQVENFSLGTQEEICRRDAKHKGYEITKVFREEGRSAKTILGRPVLKELLEYCRKNKKEIQAVYVYRLDRLSRQTSDYLAIRKRLAQYDISIISANEPTGNSPTEKLLETIMASFAQHDNDVRSERTKNGMHARFLSGLIVNHAPLGYINQGGYALKDPDSYEKIKKAWDLMATGTKSLSEMVNILRSWGFKKVGMSTVSRMFNNKFYMGILTSPKYPEVVKGQHVPMITEEQFYKVQAILRGRDPNNIGMTPKVRDNKDFPLRVIMRCGKCDTPFTGAWSKGSHARYGYYFCRKRCIKTSVSIDALDIEFRKLLNEYTPTKRGIQLYCILLRKTYSQKMAILQKTRIKSEEEIAKLKALRQLLVEKNLNGTYSDEIFNEQNKLIEEKMIAAQNAKNDAFIDKFNIDKITKFVEDKATNLEATYTNPKNDLIFIRSFIRSIFMSGFKWSYPGCSNDRLSPPYQALRDIEKNPLPFGDPSGNRTRDFRDESPTS